MDSLSTPPTPQIEPEAARIYTIGTLQYDQRGLFAVFFWLMWNAFGITLIEAIQKLNGFLMRDQGATYTQMAVVASISAFALPWINPVVSTWSDRHRGKMGRRRPFLIFAAPFFAMSMAAYPYMPGLFHFLLRYRWMVALSAHFPIKGEILFMAGCSLIGGVFNTVLYSLFMYFFLDVVPKSVLGRFFSLSKISAVVAGAIWNFYIFGQGQSNRHPKTVYVGTAVVSLAIYLISIWKIKEGEYPPPDPHKKGGMIAPVRAYLVECFSESYFLWIFVAAFLFQLGNKGAEYQGYYLHYDLHMELSTIGWATGWVQNFIGGFGLICGFFVGSLTDRLKPVRLIGPVCFLLALSVFGAYFFVRDKWTFIYWTTGINIILFWLGIVSGSFTSAIFPREKLGQFCSAQAIFSEIIIASVNPFIGKLFDHIHDNRMGFLWMSGFHFLAGIAYLKVFWNWKAKHGRAPVPHAG